MEEELRERELRGDGWQMADDVAVVDHVLSISQPVLFASDAERQDKARQEKHFTRRQDLALAPPQPGTG